MSVSIRNVTVFRFLLPTVFLIACYTRENFLGTVCCFYFFLVQYVPCAEITSSPVVANSTASKQQAFLRFGSIVFWLFTFLHLVFQVVIAAAPKLLGDESNAKTLWSSMGMMKVQSTDDVLRNIIPDLVIAVLLTVLQKLPYTSGYAFPELFTGNSALYVAYFAIYSTTSFVAVSYPSLLASPFVIGYFVFSYNFFQRKRIRPLVDYEWVYPLLGLASFVYMIIFHVYQYPYFRSNVPEYIGVVLFAEVNFNVALQQLSVVLLAFTISFVLRKRIRYARSFPAPPAHSNQAVDNHTSLIPASSRRSSFSSGVSIAHENSAFLMKLREVRRIIGRYARIYGWVAPAISLFVISLTLPSFMDLPCLVWFLLGLVFYDYLYGIYMDIIHFYVGVCLLLHYVYNIPSVFEESSLLNDIGFVKYDYPVYNIGMYCLSMYLLALYRRLRYFDFRRSQTPPRSQNYTAIFRNRFWKFTYKFVLLPLSLHAYKASLAMLFYIATLDITVFNAVFLIFSIIYLIFPGLAEKTWLLLVLYCDFVVVSFYCWQIKFFNEMQGSFVTSTGLNKYESVWDNFVFYMLLVLAVVAQYVVYNARVFFEILDKLMNPEIILDPQDRSESVDTQTLGTAVTGKSEVLYDFLYFSVNFMTYFFKKFGLPTCYAVFLLVGMTNDVTLINYVYIFFAFFGIICFSIFEHYWRIMKIAWHVVAVYAGLILCLQYIYQFEDVAEQIDNIWPSVADFDTEQFGLKAYDSYNFSYLIGSAVVLAFSVFQLRVFWHEDRENSSSPKHRRYRTQGESMPRERDLAVPSFVDTAVRFFKRFVIINSRIILMSALFLVTIETLSVLSLMYLFLFVIGLLFGNVRTISQWTILISQIYASAVYISQLEAFDQYRDDVAKKGDEDESDFDDNMDWVGLKKFESVSDLLIPHVSLMVVCAIICQSSSWMRELRSNEKDSSDQNSCLLFIQTRMPASNASYGEVIFWNLRETFNTVSMGWELFIITLLLAAFIKLDVIGLLYLFMVAPYLTMTRSSMHKSYPYLTLFLVLVLLYQMLVAVGQPPNLDRTFELPTLDDRWNEWIALRISTKYEIYADYMVCLFSQYLRNPPKLMISRPFKNDEAMFMESRWSAATQVSFFFYRFSSSVTLLIVYGLSTASCDITSLVFAGICFGMLSSLDELSLTYVHRWKYLIFYSYAYLLAKNIFQIPSISESSSAASAQVLFGMEKYGNVNALDHEDVSANIFVFVFLCAQYKILKSSKYEQLRRYTSRRNDEIKEKATQACVRLRQVVSKIADDIKSEQQHRRDRLEKLRIDRRTSYRLTSPRMDGMETIMTLDPDSQPKDSFTDEEHQAAISPDNTAEHVISNEIDDPVDSKLPLDPNAETVPLPIDRNARKSVTISDLTPMRIEEDGTRPMEELLETSESDPVEIVPDINSIDFYGGFGNRMSTEMLSEAISSLGDDEITEIEEGFKVHDEEEGPKQPSFWNRVTDRCEKLYRFIALYLRKASKWIKKRIVKASQTTYLSLLDREEGAMDSQEPPQAKVNIKMLLRVMRYNTHLGVYFFMYLAAIVYADFVSVMYAFMLFCFLRTEHLQPRKLYWLVVLVYTQLVIVIQFMFQLDYFGYCYKDSIEYSHHPLTLDETECGTLSEELQSTKFIQPPYLIGIYKIEGSFMSGTALYFLVLLAVVVHLINARTMGTFALNHLIMDTLSLRRKRHRIKSVMMGAPIYAEVESSVKDTISTVKHYWNRLTHLNDRDGRDLYVWMFSLEIASFFYIAFFYNYFSGTKQEDLAQAIESNSLPGQFVYSLFLQFIVIIIDRVVYLYRSLRLKMALQLFVVVFFHVLFFYIIPLESEVPFTENGPLVVLYIIKSLYFYVSALQISYGYPRFTGGQLLTRNYSIVGSSIFLVYRAIPFVYELRALLDWICTDTPLPFYDWLKLEDIYCGLYLVKCDIEYIKEENRALGEKQKIATKFFVGVVLFVVLVLVVWFPLLVITATSPVPGSNLVQASELQIAIVGYPNLFSNTIYANRIRSVGSESFKLLRAEYTFLEPSDLDQTQVIPFYDKSQTIWDISPPFMSSLLADLQDSSSSLQAAAVVKFYREDTTTEYLDLIARTDLTNDQKQLFYDAIVSPQNRTFIELPFILPRTLTITLDGTIENSAPSDTITVTLTSNIDAASNRLWWGATQSKTKIFTGSGVEILTISDALRDSISATLATAGIIGLYVGVVLTVGKFLRIYVSNLQQKVIYENLPDPSDLMQLCQDIYAARAEKVHDLEEQLYQELIEIYRSPAEIIERTRDKAKEKHE
eukprot:TRINITY_DN5567_c0_g1_i2.p1 TRINITY_DN5567_c0_g1~~TRINITY_DN5567_c0_g1_i2.p1  ORF type:complete len:2292 (-),score=444.02 TRINITY_DN5567_c0_g1_i2:1261-8136(-)